MGVRFLLCTALLVQLVSFSLAEPVGHCPDNNKEYVTFLTDTVDCSIFYKCETGVPIKYNCPDPLFFDPDLEVCVWREIDNCRGSGNENGNSEENGNNEENGNSEEEHNGNEGNNSSENENAGNGNGGDGGWVGECPEVDGEFVTHLPHESDCTKFYKCHEGTPVLHSCPPGLHYNKQLEVCDYSENVGCESGSGNGGNEGGNDGNGNGSDENENGGNGNGENGNGGNGNGGWVGECPEVDGEFVIHLPHESDCTKFYKCHEGTPVLHYCPPGLHYNKQLQVCDYSENVGCESGSGNGGNEGGSVGNGNGSDENENGGNGNGGNGNGDNGNGGWVGECPEVDGEFATHLPHESDCTKFYKCHEGIPVLQNCPHGLHYNKQLHVCDYAENAGCESGSGNGGNGGGSDGDGNESNENGNIDHGEGSEENNSNENGTGSGACAAIKCPIVNGEFVTFIPKDPDCRRFCKCDWGIAYEFYCSDGLYFNPTLNVCDYPERSGCTM